MRAGFGRSNASIENQSQASLSPMLLSASRSGPNLVAPHPLGRRVAHPGFELAVHFLHSRSHVRSSIGRARYPQLLDLDPETTAGTDPHAASHPDASTGAPR